MTDTRVVRKEWGEEYIEFMRDEGMSEEEIERVFLDDDLWLVEPYRRYETLAGEKAVKAWEAAADFAIEMMQIASRRGMFADGTSEALAWLLQDAHARATEAARRERERVEASSSG